MTAELVLRWSGGELDLMGWNASDYGDFTLDTLADGTDWGNPEPVRRALRRFLADGSRSVKEYDDNRTIALSLRVTAPDGSALAGGEQALDLIDGRRCELVWTPPDPFSAPAVFVVDFADLRHKFDDLAEMRTPPERFYTLTLDCLPHAYSDEWVEVPALPQSVSTRFEIEAADTLANWSASGLTIADAGDYVQATFVDGVNSGILTSAPVADFTSTPYLAVTRKGAGVGVETAVEVRESGAWRRVYRVGTDAGADLYYVGASSITGVRFKVDRPALYNSISATPALGIASLGRQATMRTAAANGQVRTVQVPGSRRTPARLQASSAAGNLGDLIMFSGPNYDPSLITRLAAGYTNTLATAPYTPSDEVLYRLPLSQVPPGEYAIWAQVTSSPAGEWTEMTFTVEAELQDAANTVLRSTGLETVSLPSSTSALVAICSGTLPGWDLPEGSPRQFGLRFTLTEGEGAVTFHHVWLFNITTGDLIIVKAGTDSNAWVEPPSLDRDHMSVLTGDDTLPHALPRSLSTEILSTSTGVYLTPGTATIYAWSSSATDVEVSARFRPAWHTHPAS